VSAVDPAASMAGVANPNLAAIAGDVRDLLETMVTEL
jgi:hypothetical protein